MAVKSKKKNPMGDTWTVMHANPAGDQVVTVSRYGSKMARSGSVSHPIWTGSVYEARARQDGAVTYRLLRHFGRTASGPRPSAKFVAEVRAAAKTMGLPFLSGIRHGKPAPSSNPASKKAKELSPFEYHQVQVAKKAIRMPSPMLGVMGGMSYEEAVGVLRKHGIKPNPASKKAKAKYYRQVDEQDYVGAGKTMKRIHAGLEGAAKRKKNPSYKVSFSASADPKEVRKSLKAAGFTDLRVRSSVKGKKRAPGPYAKFVQAHMKGIMAKGKSAPEAMKEIGKMWKAKGAKSNPAKSKRHRK